MATKTTRKAAKRLPKNVKSGYSDEIVQKLKRLLAVHGTIHLNLEKINNGSTKKMRFTILSLCPKCKAANHVENVDMTERIMLNCNKCNNKQVYALKTDVLEVKTAIGVPHRSHHYFPNQGSFGPEGIRGDIIVTCLDERHDHFLRVKDHILVCFQIDLEESINGVTRLLNLNVPRNCTAIIKTKKGEEKIQNNDVFFVECMGLPNHWDNNVRGRLVVVFFIAKKRSMLPVPLRKVRMKRRGYHRSENSSNDDSTVIISEDETSSSIIIDGVNLNGVSTPQPNLKRKRALVRASGSPAERNTRNKRLKALPNSLKSASFESNESNRFCHSESPFLTTIMEDSTFMGLKPPALETLSFLDRLVLTQSIPMPYKTNGVDEIPMEDLTSLFLQKKNASWWRRIAMIKAPMDDLDQEIKQRYDSFQAEDPKKVSLEDVPTFYLENEDISESLEASKTMSTTLAAWRPITRMRLTLNKLNLSEKWRLLRDMGHYLLERDY